MRTFLLIPLMFACAPAMAQQPAISPSTSASVNAAQIVTSARGEARAKPDRATIMIGVQTRAATAAQAASENATKQEAVLAALRRLGLTNDQLSTIEYNVHPEMRYSEREEPRVIGYTVQNTIRADITRIEQIGAVLDAALGAGANTINSLTFNTSNIEEVRRQAIARAMENARSDAEVLARAAGGSLGRLLEASTVEISIPLMRRSMARMEMAQAAAEPTPIQPGEQQVTASVTATWEFVPAR